MSSVLSSLVNNVTSIHMCILILKYKTFVVHLLNYNMVMYSLIVITVP